MRSVELDRLRVVRDRLRNYARLLPATDERARTALQKASLDVSLALKLLEERLAQKL